MAKRSASSSTSWKNVSKKTKVEEFGDFWEDDLDEDAIDDCFKKATQESCADVSLLSSYSVFKQPNQLLTSTQYSQSLVVNKGNVENYIQELVEKCAQKEGEVSILRSNLHNLRTSCQVDQERKDVEWKEKLSLIERENKTFKSDLEFKNLEITNLKQQIIELSKLVNVEQNTTQKFHQSSDNYSKVLPNSPEKSINSPRSGTARIYVNLQKCSALKRFDSLFTRQRFCNVLKNIMSSKEDTDKLKEADVRVESIMNSFSEETMLFGNLSPEDLNSDQVDPSINKVVWFSYQLLKILNHHLDEMQKNSSGSKINEESVQYLCTDRLQQINFCCTEVLSFLQELLLFNTFLGHCVLVESSYLNNNKSNDTQLFGDVGESHYLLLLSHTISMIGKTKQEKNYEAFLSMAIKLLCRIFNSNNSTHYRQTTSMNVVMELLTLDLDFQLIQQLNVLLNICLRSHNLNNLLFSNHENSKDNSTKESCRFSTYFSLLEGASLKIEKETEFSSFTSNILNLTHNFLKIDIKCGCVSSLYKLSIRIIYKNLTSYQSFRNRTALVPKIYVEVLSLIIFNAYDLTQKYIIDYARIKKIMYTIAYINGEKVNMNLKNLDKSSATEDFPPIPKGKFNSLNL